MINEKHDVDVASPYDHRFSSYSQICAKIGPMVAKNDASTILITDWNLATSDVS